MRNKVIFCFLVALGIGASIANADSQAETDSARHQHCVKQGGVLVEAKDIVPGVCVFDLKWTLSDIVNVLNVVKSDFGPPIFIIGKNKDIFEIWFGSFVNLLSGSGEIVEVKKSKNTWKVIRRGSFVS